MQNRCSSVTHTDYGGKIQISRMLNLIVKKIQPWFIQFENMLIWCACQKEIQHVGFFLLEAIVFNDF